MTAGAGLAGLATAYELTEWGYDCRVLKGGSAAGRCHTNRRRTVSEEMARPRWPHSTTGSLPTRADGRPAPPSDDAAYCRELGLEIEVFVNDNGAAFVYQRRGRFAPSASGATKSSI